MTGQERAIDRSQVGSLSSPFGSSILRYPLAAAYLLHWLSLGGQWWWVSVALPWSVILGPMQDMGAQQTWRAEAKGTTELPSGYQGFRSKNETLLMVQDRLSTSLGDISRSDWQQHLRSTCSPESWMGPREHGSLAGFDPEEWPPWDLPTDSWGVQGSGPLFPGNLPCRPLAPSASAVWTVGGGPPDSREHPAPEW